MANVLGFEIPTPDFNVTGLASDTWFYIAIVFVLGLIIIGGVGFFLYNRTFSRRIVLFENISGLGYQPSLKTRARIVKLGSGGEELLKTQAGGNYVTAYGKKMGKNTYWFAKGQDGYWYNIVLGDLDTKFNMLDIEPVDRDVRMMHVAIDRLSEQTYNKTSFLEKYGAHMIMFLFLIVLVLGMWFIIGQVGNATSSLAESSRILADALEKSNNLRGGSGLVPAG